jgi:DNA-binding winged helix-turn-helix (wHTH) protein/tetratricopeptide (TPR) repeat protein
LAIGLGDFVLDDARLELRRGRTRIRVQPKVLALLLHLVERRERAVSNDELLRLLWPDERVTEASVRRAIRGARLALGDDGDSQASIRTVRGHGYQLVLPVRVVDDEQPAQPEPDGNGAKSAGTAVAPSTELQDVFVGRSAAFAVLDAGMREACAGHGRVLLVVGEPGIGKTRTMLEFAQRATVAGAETWFGRCIEDEGAPAFWPWTQMLRDAERARGADALLALMGKSAADIAEGIPELRQWLSDVPAAPAIAELSARFRFFDGVAQFLKRAATARPLLLLFDDLQRADQPTVRLLSFVARNLDGCRLLIVAGLRPLASQPASMREALTSFVHEARARCIELEGFGRDEVDRYVELRTGQRGPSAGVDWLHQLTAGNPLFLQQILQGASQHGRRDGSLDWDGLLEGSQGQGLAGSIARLLGGFDPAVRKLLRAASVFGTEFTLARLSQLLEVDAASLLPLLATAIGAGIVRADLSALGAYRFTHLLLRDALYRDLAVDERALLHARAGALIEAAGWASDTTLAELAHHFAEAWPAHDDGKAMRYGLQAADAAQERLAYEEAVAHLDRALCILASSPCDPRQRMRLLLKKGEALGHAAEAEKARAALLGAAALARELADHEVLARAASLIACLPESGNVDRECLGLLREAIALLSEDDPQRPFLLALLAKTLTYTSETEARTALALTAVEQSQRVSDPMLRAEVLHQAQRALAEPTHLCEREAITAALLRLGHAHGSYRVLGNAAIAQLQNCLERGDVVGIDRAMAELERIAAHAREPIFRWYLQVLRSMRCYIAGDMAGVERAALDALAMGACVGDETARHTHAMQCAGMYRVVGRLAEYEAQARENMLRFPARVGWRLALAHGEADRGRYELALSMLEQVMTDPSALDPFTMSTLAPLAELCGFFGTVEMAKQLYQHMLPFAALWGNIGFGVSTYGPIARALGMLAIRARELDTAERHIETALASAVAAKSPTFESLALMAHARALLKRNGRASRDRARDMLAAAESINRRWGFIGNSNMVRLMLRRSGLALPEVSARASADA